MNAQKIHAISITAGGQTADYRETWSYADHHLRTHIHADSHKPQSHATTEILGADHRWTEIAHLRSAEMKTDAGDICYRPKDTKPNANPQDFRTDRDALHAETKRLLEEPK